MSENTQRMDSISQPILRVNLLGPIEIRTEKGGLIELPRKVRALFAYLLTRRGTLVPRQTLLGLFWGDRAEEQARASLRQALNILRTSLGDMVDSVISSTSESVSIRDGSVLTDLDEFEKRMDSPVTETPVEFKSLEFLEGLAIGEAGFEGWISEERERVQARLVGLFKYLAADNEAAGRFDFAASHTASWLHLAPFDEDAHRQMMRLHLARSRTDAAIRQFEKCRATLHENLNVEPDVQTVALWEDAKRMRLSKVTPPGETIKKRGAATPFLAAFSCNNQVRSIIEAEIAKFGGREISNGDEQLLVEFRDAAEALRACLTARIRVRELSGGAGADVSIALHFGEETEPGVSHGPEDVARLTVVLASTPADQIHVSSRFFQAVRRNSPCFFDDLSDTENPETVGVFRAGQPMNRQPFLAVYENQTPRRVKRACSLAVAPIKYVGNGDGSNDYWAEGLTEDLILELSRTNRIEVSSRTTLFAIKSHDAVEIGHELGVGYVLFGSFRQMGQSARLNFTLAETENGSVVWSERFTADFEEIFDVLDEIVAKVVARIAGKIEQSEIETARIKRPENMTAYEFYLRGIWHHRMGGVTTAHSRKAVEWLTKAIKADPSFHRPRAMLACAWSDLPEYDDERADRSVAKALEADPTDPDANRIMAWVKFTKGEFDLGIRYAEQSVDLAPHDAYLLGRCAVLHIFNGDPEIGLARLHRAIELDPFVPVYIVEEHLTAYYALGDYEKVISEARDLNHQTRRSTYYTAASLVALDRLDAARRVIRNALEDDPSLSSDYVRGQEIYRDQRILQTLLDRLSIAGLPE